MIRKFLITTSVVLIIGTGLGYCDSISVEYVDLLENYMSGKTTEEKAKIGEMLKLMFADNETLEISKTQYLDKMDDSQKETLKRLGITSDQIVNNFEALKSWSKDDRKKLVELAKNGNKDGILSLNNSYKNNSGTGSNSGSSSGSVGGGASGSQGPIVTNPTESNIPESIKSEISLGFRSTEIPVLIDHDYKSFKDIEKHWSKDYVDFFAKRGIVNGKNNNNFKPDDDITKAEITKIVSEVFIKDSSSLTSKELSFKDIKTDDWYYKYVKNLNDIGVIDQSEKFEGDKYPSREEIIDLMIKTLKSSGISISSDGSKFNREFKDISAIDSKYRESVVIAENLGIINGVGDNKLDPKSTVTRAQVMALTKNLYDYIMQNLN